MRQALPPGTEPPIRLARARRDRILDQLATRGAVAVSALAAELAVSEMTVRRDLNDLERAGRLVRTHGGAVPIGLGMRETHLVSTDQEEPSFGARLRRGAEAKEAIASAVAQLAATFRTIALDIGTTTYMTARHLRSLPHARVFTNSLRVAEALEGGTTETYVAGGRVRMDEMSVVGASAIAQFEELWFDVAVIGASGITADGFFDYSPEEAEMKRVYLRRSGMRILACDSNKFQRLSLVHVGILAEISLMVTDTAPPEPLAQALARAGVATRIVA